LWAVRILVQIRDLVVVARRKTGGESRGGSEMSNSDSHVSLVSRRGPYGVTRTLTPMLRVFGIDAYSSPCVPAWFLYEASGSTFGTLVQVYRLRPVIATLRADAWNFDAQRCGSSRPMRSSRSFT